MGNRMGASGGLVVLLLLPLVMVAYSCCCCCCAEAKVHASIKNGVGDGKAMSVHCQSKDNDLGNQTVVDGGEFGWDFAPNVWGTTLFYCSMDSPSLNLTGFAFSAYDYGRDRVRCASLCSWLISAQGMFAVNDQTGFWEFMYTWPSL